MDGSVEFSMTRVLSFLLPETALRTEGWRRYFHCSYRRRVLVDWSRIANESHPRRTRTATLFLWVVNRGRLDRRYSFVTRHRADAKTRHKLDALPTHVISPCSVHIMNFSRAAAVSMTSVLREITLWSTNRCGRSSVFIRLDLQSTQVDQNPIPMAMFTFIFIN